VTWRYVKAANRAAALAILEEAREAEVEAAHAPDGSKE
jgi:hypothetical protein